jgi:hypothetical protein
LLIPILADTSFFRELNLEVGGRYSDYNTTGASWTYKALLDWSGQRLAALPRRLQPC